MLLLGPHRFLADVVAVNAVHGARCLTAHFDSNLSLREVGDGHIGCWRTHFGAPLLSAPAAPVNLRVFIAMRRRDSPACQSPSLMSLPQIDMNTGPSYTNFQERVVQAAEAALK